VARDQPADALVERIFFLVVLLYQIGIRRSIPKGHYQVFLDAARPDKKETTMSRDYLDAIVHCYIDGRHEFKRYKLIKNIEPKLQKFETFVRRTFQGADYVNYYWHHLPDGSNYAFRRYLTPKEAVS